MREDGAIARAAAEWEARLTPMAEAVAPGPPPARAWRWIESRPGPKGPSPARFAVWKALAMLASGAAAALVVMRVVLPPQKAATASYVAVLSDPKTQKPVLYVSAGRKDTQL